MLSNATTTIDSITKYEQYIDRAKELGMKAICFSEHGNVMHWVSKKKYCDEVGIKYIHGIEIYVTKSINEKARDNYHVVLMAANWDGVKEINKLSSIAFNRADVKVVDDNERFYYQPRITYDELKQTSDNIIISTACLGGILNSGDSELENDFIEFLKENKHRCFLEVQHHPNAEEQKKHNIKLVDIANHYNIRLIAGTDTHSISIDDFEARSILQKAKKVAYDNENEWDLIFKTYDELVDSFQQQGVLSKAMYMSAIENTNELFDMVEDFDLDRTNKYPVLYENTEEVFKEKLIEGIKRRNINVDDERYKSRIEYETSVVKKQGALDLFMLEEMVKRYARENNIDYGYSRGSASGSILLYLLGATEVDSVKYNLNFERFMSPERISLADIDSDWDPNKREDVKKFLYSIGVLQCSEVITFNTVADKGAIRDVGRALQIPLSEVDNISKSLERDEESLRNKYVELFKYVDILKGVVVSIGTHPAATIIYDDSLQELIGTCTTSNSPFPVSQIDMKEIDYLNLVKLDILGLDNVPLIADTCRMAGVDVLTPDNMNFDDIAVWKSVKEGSVGCFQFTSSYAWNYLCTLLSDETIEKMKAEGGDIDYLYLTTIATGAIRPAGDSYRDNIADGQFTKRGHEALDKFLSKTRGELVFQETIIEFLNRFCGYTLGEADLIRRGFAKKTGTEQYIPQIKSSFIETMVNIYQTDKEKSEELIESFIKVIEDASDYLFSLLHGLAYTMITYACLYLRHYYKIEFLTTLLNIEKDDLDKTNAIVEYAQKFNIKIKPPRFRYSRAKYFFDKNESSIYKGVGSIKGLSESIGEYLYSIRELQFNSFIDLLIYIEENNTLSKKTGDLIKLQYFQEFGNNAKLLTIFNEFKDGKNRYSKKHSDKTKIKRIEALQELEQTLENKNIPLNEQLDFEREILGYIQCTYEVNPRFAYVMGIDTKFAPRVELYFLHSGKSKSLKIYKRDFNKTPITIGNIIDCKVTTDKPSQKYVDGNYVENPDVMTTWLTNYTIKR